MRLAVVAAQPVAVLVRPLVAPAPLELAAARQEAALEPGSVEAAPEQPAPALVGVCAHEVCTNRVRKSCHPHGFGWCGCSARIRRLLRLRHAHDTISVINSVTNSVSGDDRGVMETGSKRVDHNNEKGIITQSSACMQQWSR